MGDLVGEKKIKDSCGKLLVIQWYITCDISSIYISVYICVYICAKENCDPVIYYLCIYLCISLYICAYMCISVYICVYIWAYICVYISVKVGNTRFLRKTVGDPVIYYLCASGEPISIIYAHDTSIGLSQAISLHWHSGREARKEEFWFWLLKVLTLKFWPCNFDQKNVATEFWPQGGQQRGVLQQNFKETPAAGAVASQMSNVFWYPSSFVPNKFALDPFFMLRYKISKRSASLWWSAIFTAYLTFHSLNKKALEGLIIQFEKLWPNVDFERNCVGYQNTFSGVQEESNRSSNLTANGFKSPEQRNELEINWSVFKCFSLQRNELEMNWSVFECFFWLLLGQINDGASRYKGGARVRKAANGHICNKPNQKCNKPEM